MKNELTHQFLKTMTFTKAVKLLAAERQVPEKDITDDRIDIGDSGLKGLSIRVSRDDKLTWTFTFRSPDTKKQKREWLGVFGDEAYGGMTLDAARIKAGQLKTSVHNKTDPQSVRLAQAPTVTFEQAMEERLDRYVRGKTKSEETIIERYRATFAHLKDMDIKAFKKNPHYNDMIRPHEKAERLRTADIIRSDLKCIFDYAVEMDYVENNPILSTKRLNGDDEMDRALSPEEIKILWPRLGEVLTPRIATILKLELVTGQRSGEVGGLTDMEIIENGPDDWVWVLPATVRNRKTKKIITKGRTKNGKEHQVPLSRLAIKLIKEARRLTNSPILFKGPVTGKPANSADVSSDLWKFFQRDADGEASVFGIDKFTAHALRHTAVTGMVGLGVADGVVSRVVNHSAAKKKQANAFADAGNDDEAGARITQRYIGGRAATTKCPYLDKKRAALNLWGDYLADLVGEDLDGPKLKLVA